MDDNIIIGEKNPPGKMHPRATSFEVEGKCPRCYGNGGARLTAQDDGTFGLPFIPEPCSECGVEASV